MTQDCMIDLETLGTSPETPVISIGASFFDIENKKLGVTFYMVADVSEQIARGRKPTGETIKWWLSQTDAAKRVFHEKAKPMKEVLAAFVHWYATNGTMVSVAPIKNRAYVWGNGSTFDISIMENLFRDYVLDLPWGYNKTMDLRTFRRFKTELNKSAKIHNVGVAHNALDDAVSQAQFVLDNS